MARRGWASRAVVLLIAFALLAGLALVERWREDDPPTIAGGEQPALTQPSPASTASRTPPTDASAPSLVPDASRPVAIDTAAGRSQALLEAVAPATAAAGEWGVGGLISPVRAQRPGSAPLDPELLGPTCDGGRLLTAEQVVVVGYRGRRPVGVTVAGVVGQGPRAEVDTIADLDTVDGAVLLAPRGDRVWRPGYYTVELERSLRSSKRPPVRRLVFCVGMYEPNGALTVPSSIYGAASD